MIQSGCPVFGALERHELVLESVAEFLAFVSDNFQRNAIKTEQYLEHSLGRGVGFFFRDCHKFNVLGKGVCNGQDVLLILFRRDKWPQKVSMDPLIWLGCLRHWLKM